MKLALFSSLINLATSAEHEVAVAFHDTLDGGHRMILSVGSDAVSALNMAEGELKTLFVAAGTKLGILETDATKLAETAAGDVAGAASTAQSALDLGTSTSSTTTTLAADPAAPPAATGTVENGSAATTEPVAGTVEPTASASTETSPS